MILNPLKNLLPTKAKVRQRIKLHLANLRRMLAKNSFAYCVKKLR